MEYVVDPSDFVNVEGFERSHSQSSITVNRFQFADSSAADGESDDEDAGTIVVHVSEADEFEPVPKKRKKTQSRGYFKNEIYSPCS